MTVQSTRSGDVQENRRKPHLKTRKKARRLSLSNVADLFIVRSHLQVPSQAGLLPGPEGNQGGSHFPDTQVRRHSANTKAQDYWAQHLKWPSFLQGRKKDHPQTMTHLVIQDPKIHTKGGCLFVTRQNRWQNPSKRHHVKVLVWPPSRPPGPVENLMALPNQMSRVVGNTCAHRIENRAEKELCIEPHLFGCGAVQVRDSSLPGSPQRTQMQGEIDAQKALHSCSISSFTASIIKGGFNRLSNTNSPISRRRPVQSHRR